jgi:hypothetical protein
MKHYAILAGIAFAGLMLGVAVSGYKQTAATATTNSTSPA